MMKSKLCMQLLIGLFLSSRLLGQTVKIRGEIKDESGSPISATIKVLPSGPMAAADESGKFVIEAAAGSQLQITSVGYTTKTITVDDASKPVTITLTSLSSDLAPVTVGSRGRPRSSIESPVPVDVVKMSSLTTTMSRPDLMSQLMVGVPSFNYNKQSGADIADAVDFATLRGMGYDHTLVLVNGIRRHTTSYVSLGGISGSGVDMNTIPQAAIDHIEVLRDGASAQYGSDAIAGVINIILKKDVNHFNMTGGWSSYYDSKYNTLKAEDPSLYYTGHKIDGTSFNANADWGAALGKKGGFINISGNFLTQGKTFRGNTDNTTLIQTRRAFGDGSVTSAGGMYNLELPLSGETKLYSFGGYNYKHSNAYAWTRAFSNPLRYPTDDNGNIIFVPGIMQVADGGMVDGKLVDTSKVYYNPQEDSYLRDISGAVGIKGVASGWDWNLSNNTGFSDVHIWGNKTFNASLPLPEEYTKTRFNDGGFNYLLNVSNLDFSKRFAHVAQGFTLAFGAEFRYEKYHLYAGEPDSYEQGGAVYNGTASGYASKPKASGSQGYPGYQPSDAVKAHRTNIGGYIDGSLDITKRWMLDGAARFENYSDFGFVNVYKLATLYKISDYVNIRGSFSSGFRAPTLQELNFSEVNTTVTSGGDLQYTKLIPNYSDVARAVGIPKLKQETSLNYSLGFTWKPSDNFTATVDGYLIKLKNRIVVTGNYDESNAQIAAYLQQNNLVAGNFFVNAVNTTNKGIDVVLDYHQSWDKNRLGIMFTGNIQNVSIDKINMPSTLGNTYLDMQQFFGTMPEYNLKAAAPKEKFVLNPELTLNKVTIGARATYWGKIVKVGYGYASLPGADPDGPGGANISAAGMGWDPYVELDDGSGVVPEQFVYGGKVTTDIYLNFRIAKSLNLVLGVDNLFNVHPDPAYTKGARSNSWNDFPTGGYFDNVQMGFNGMRMFSKLIINL